MLPKALFVGVTTLDIQYMVESYPLENSKTGSSGFTISTGGPATNAAVTFSCLGGESHLLSVIGNNHPFSKFMYNDLEDLGIKLYDLNPDSSDNPTIASIITCLDSGNRSIVYSRGGTDHYQVNLAKILQAGDYHMILVDGMNMKACIETAKYGKSKGLPVVLDGGSWKERMEELLPFITIAICSGDFYPPGTRTQDEAMAYLIDHQIRSGAVTRGGNPVIFYDGYETGEIPVPAIEIIDSLGAGDVFHGAFCFYFLETKDFRKSLRMASDIASRSCRSIGTRAWMTNSKQESAL